jgi:hypothetical protein
MMLSRWWMFVFMFALSCGSSTIAFFTNAAEGQLRNHNHKLHIIQHRSILLPPGGILNDADDARCRHRGSSSYSIHGPAIVALPRGGSTAVMSRRQMATNSEEEAATLVKDPEQVGAFVVRFFGLNPHTTCGMLCSRL